MIVHSKDHFQSNTMLMTEYIYLFSRIVMADPQVFLQLISAAAARLNRKVDYLMEGLLDQWWGKVRPHKPLPSPLTTECSSTT
jgi:hypothetical protein